jgi:DNA-directed RNA polymerase subunit RPC12/RpoP
MFIEIVQVQTEYSRTSKRGKSHKYYRTRKEARLQCDSCGQEFSRPVGRIDPKRLSNEYAHVCPDCDGKRFAQSKGAERRRFWNITVDSDLDITDL